MIRIASASLALFAVAACATTETPSATSIEAIQAARMADLLTETAQTSPERIRAAQAELAALQRALTTASTPEATGPRTVVPEPLRLAEAPDLSGAASLMSAVHVASYREYANLQSGWAELQGQAPNVLGPLQARVAEVDLGERGVYLRLKAGPLDNAEQARALCAQLEAAGQWCRPTDYTGTQLQP